jgi:nucleoside-diphosphate-sugar epimerase
VKTILVTGAHGFIAGMLAAHWRGSGCRVVGTARTAGSVPGFDAVYVCALGESLEALLASERVDAVVHTAYFAGPGEYEINVNGTTRWLEEARARGVATHVFLSSLSAAQSDASDYARAKRELETRFLATKGVVVRLGLVAGKGGLFGRMVQSVQRLPVLPVLDGGSSPVYLVNPRSLAAFVDAAVLAGRPDLQGRIWHIHEPASYPLRKVLEAIRTHSGASCRFVSIPSRPVLWALTLAERIPGVRLPVNSTNIRGLRASTVSQLPSDLEQLGGRPETLDRIIADAVRDQVPA